MPDISAPNAGAYSLWGPQYAAALAGQTNNPVSGPLNMMAMRGYMGNEQGAYSQDLRQTQLAQLQAAREAGDVELQKALIGQLGAAIEHGGTGWLDPLLQGSGLNVDAQAGSVIDASQRNEEAARALNNRATGLNAVADIGFAPPAEQIAPTLMPANPAAPLPDFVPYMTPGNTNDATTAAAAMRSADARMVQANRPPSSGGGNSPDDWVTITEEGDRDENGVTRKTTRRVRANNPGITAPPISPVAAGGARSPQEILAAIAAANPRR